MPYREHSESNSVSSSYLVLDLNQVAKNKKYFTDELKSNNDVLTLKVEEHRLKQLRLEKLKLDQAKLRSALAAKKGDIFSADATDRRMAEEDERRKQLVVQVAKLQKDLHYDKQENQRALDEWNKGKQEVHFEMTSYRDQIRQDTNDKKHKNVLLREEIARLRRAKAQMANRSVEHQEMIARAEREKREQEARLKAFIEQMTTMENGEIARNLDEYKRYYTKKLNQASKEELENLAREQAVMKAKCAQMERENLAMVERQAELVKEIDAMKLKIKAQKAREAELVKIIQEVYKSNNASTQEYTDMIERLQVERHKVNEEIQRLLLELRAVIANIAHLQSEINHYRILLNPNEIIIDYHETKEASRSTSPTSTILIPSPSTVTPPRTPSPIIIPMKTPTPPRSPTPTPVVIESDTSSVASMASSQYKPGRFYMAGHGLQGGYVSSTFSDV